MTETSLKPYKGVDTFAVTETSDKRLGVVKVGKPVESVDFVQEYFSAKPLALPVKVALAIGSTPVGNISLAINWGVTDEERFYEWCPDGHCIAGENMRARRITSRYSDHIPTGIELYQATQRLVNGGAWSKPMEVGINWMTQFPVQLYPALAGSSLSYNKRNTLGMTRDEHGKVADGEQYEEEVATIYWRGDGKNPVVPYMRRRVSMAKIGGRNDSEVNFDIFDRAGNLVTNVNFTGSGWSSNWLTDGKTTHHLPGGSVFTVDNAGQHVSSGSRRIGASDRQLVFGAPVFAAETVSGKPLLPKVVDLAGILRAAPSVLPVYYTDGLQTPRGMNNAGNMFQECRVDGVSNVENMIGMDTLSKTFGLVGPGEYQEKQVEWLVEQIDNRAPNRKQITGGR